MKVGEGRMAIAYSERLDSENSSATCTPLQVEGTRFLSAFVVISLVCTKFCLASRRYLFCFRSLSISTMSRRTPSHLT